MRTIAYPRCSPVWIDLVMVALAALAAAAGPAEARGLAGLPLPATSQGHGAQEWTLQGDRILVSNLVGHIKVGAATGGRIIVRVQAQGADAERLRFEADEGGRAQFHVVFPLEDHRRYVYPEMGRGSSTTIGWWPPKDRTSLLEAFLGHLTGERIEIRGRPWDDALEAWADVEILVPEGKPAAVILGAGSIEAAGVRSSLDLDTRSGPVSVTDVTGDVMIDTGSGHVRARSVHGDLGIDTGSGSVDVEDVIGARVSLDTGSGRVEARGVEARRLVIDTGSGSVRADEIDAKRANIDTGSGSVHLDLVGMGVGDYVIDTGSGGITLRLPPSASARIEASTGSGGIDIGVPGARVRRLSRDEVSLELGDGRARVVLDTGSGGIRIVQRS
ncbi:MAG: DUF4097 family beta strand repeat protein [Gemmatimonadetes bacterium]|nr:DUF4097 family beta strand repeat protein [Gemmatimonadota bacterium]